MLFVCFLATLAGPVGNSAALAEGDAAGERTIVPTLALETEQYSEVSRLALATAEQSEARSLWVSRLALGLQYDLSRNWLGAGKLKGQTSLGLGIVFALGHWPLHLRQEILFTRRATPSLSLLAGFGTGFQINTFDIHRSHWELGLALGVAIADRVEAIYCPMLTVGMGDKKEQVFGGTRAHGIATELAPLGFVVRARFNGLGFR